MPLFVLATYGTIHIKTVWYNYYSSKSRWKVADAWSFSVYREPISRSMQLHYILTDRHIFRSNLPGMELPWECHDQSHESNWRHFVTGPEPAFFHKRKRILIIDVFNSDVYRLRMGIASSYSSAPVSQHLLKKITHSRFNWHLETRVYLSPFATFGSCIIG